MNHLQDWKEKLSVLVNYSVNSNMWSETIVLYAPPIIVTLMVIFGTIMFLRIFTNFEQNDQSFDTIINDNNDDDTVISANNQSEKTVSQVCNTVKTSSSKTLKKTSSVENDKNNCNVFETESDDIDRSENTYDTRVAQAVSENMEEEMKSVSLEVTEIVPKINEKNTEKNNANNKYMTVSNDKDTIETSDTNNNISKENVAKEETMKEKYKKVGNIFNPSQIIANGTNSAKRKSYQLPKVEQLGTISLKKLNEFDCNAKRQCVSILGTIFDVSEAGYKYGPKGTYNSFSGHDITLCLGSGKLSEKWLDRFVQLSFKQRSSADGWMGLYEKQYPKCGKLDIWQQDTTKWPRLTQTEKEELNAECSIM